jgi:uncharacterized protein (DUF983 family)
VSTALIRILRVFWQCLLLRCPACERGRMFRSAFRMNVRCPVCGTIFERDAGEITGGIAINSIVTMFLAICGAFLAFIEEIPLNALLGVLIAITIVFPIAFYRHSRAFWIGIIYLTGSIAED